MEIINFLQESNECPTENTNYSPWQCQTTRRTQTRTEKRHKKEELTKTGKLVEGNSTDKLVDRVFLSLKAALDEKTGISEDITRYSNIDVLPLGMKKACV